MSTIGGKRKENTENSDYSKCVGLFEAKVIAINPTAEQYKNLLNIELKEDSKATEYLGTNNDGNDYLRVDIWLEDIIEFKLEHKEYFPEIRDFEQYLGTWKTNQVIWDSEYGFDETFSELTRVEKKEVISYEWVTITE